jgi:hypothetical protein
MFGGIAPPLNASVRPRPRLTATVIVLNYAFYACGAVALVTLPFMLINTVRATYKVPQRPTALQRWESLPKKSMMIFGGSIILGILLSTVVSAFAQRHALAFLTALTGPHTVTVDGRPMVNEGAIISDLKAVHYSIGHHSRPTAMLMVSIQAGAGHLELNLGRDSDEPQEYWVYAADPKYRAGSDIGRIMTNALDGY